MNAPQSIKIDNVEYVRADSLQRKANEWNGLPYKLVRTQSAGVFAGYLESRNGREVVMRNARRIWYWNGAASLSQLAMQGTTKPKDCKFAVPVDRVELLETIEILDVTAVAQQSISSVVEWKQ